MQWGSPYGASCIVTIAGRVLDKSLGTTRTRYATAVPVSVLYPLVPVSGILPVVLAGIYRHYKGVSAPLEYQTGVYYTLEQQRFYCESSHGKGCTLWAKGF